MVGTFFGPPKDMSVRVERDVVVDGCSLGQVLAVVVVMEGGGEEGEDLPLVVAGPLLIVELVP